ncbi:MAG: response regulator [Bacteroidota bacterium]|nr:response regulator [Bacteroidota bacterium]
MKTILVADDDLAILEAMQMLLEDDGYDVITTANGKDVKKLCGKKPDLVFLDIWMSGIDGKVICRQIKEDPATSEIPVVMFSANRDTKEISLECGADDFILKPFEIKDLLALVHKYV